MLSDIFSDDVFRLETARLWLRWPTGRDAVFIERFARQEIVSGMTGTWPHPLPPGYVAERIDRCRAENASGDGVTLALTTKTEHRRVIGLVGASLEDDGRALSLGYMLAPEHWGRRLMTETIGGLVDLVFATSGIDRFIATVFPINLRSRAVLEANGFHLEARTAVDAPARGGLVAVDRYHLPRETWRQQAALRASTRATPVPHGASHGEMVA